MCREHTIHSFVVVATAVVSPSFTMESGVICAEWKISAKILTRLFNVMLIFVIAVKGIRDFVIQIPLYPDLQVNRAYW